MCGSCVQLTQIGVKLEPIEVESLRLRDLLIEYEQIDFLKMDIEGAEVDVIEDCTNLLSKNDRLFISIIYL